jgi:hypothetical protein
MGEPKVSSFSASKATANSVPAHKNEIALSAGRSQITPVRSSMLQGFPTVVRQSHDFNIGVIKADSGIFSGEENRFAAGEDLRPAMGPLFSLKLGDRSRSAAVGGNS